MALEVTDGSIKKMEYLTEGVYTGAAHQHFSFDLVSDIDASSPVEAAAGKLKKPSSSECVCCLSNTATVALVPCGHLCMCTKCLPEISDHLCPSCRQPFVSSLVIFIS